MRAKQKKQNKAARTPAKPADYRRPFVEHLYEIRTRLFFVLGSILLFSTIAYFVQQKLVHFLLAPAKSQQFIYTSPGGGISFLFQICTYAGIIASLPVIIYQLMRFLEPVTPKNLSKVIFKISIVSFLLALGGFVFGYLVGLPVALHFLGDQFTTSQIHALFTIQEYMSFLSIYLGGSALLFQLPLVVWLIDRIKPKGPKRFLRYERHVIAGSFIIAMLMAPVPNLIYQSLIALPIIVMYQIAILIVWYEHRPGGQFAIEKLLRQDNEKRLERLKQAESAINLVSQTSVAEPEPEEPQPQPVSPMVSPARIPIKIAVDT